MNSSWQWIREDLFWPTVLGCGVLLLAFLAKELLGPKQRLLPLRLFAVLVAVGSLAMLLLRPAFPTTAYKGVGALLTEGYRPSTLDSLRKKYRKLAVETYDAEGNMAPFLDSVGPLYVLGNGLPPYDLWQLRHRSVAYVPGEAPKGIAQLSYGQRAVLGEELVLQGRYEGPTAGHGLALVDPAGNVLDSLVWEEGRSPYFQLRMVPKATGTFVYGLWETAANQEVLRREPLPVEVRAPRALTVLMLHDFPTFEAKYLKNFLAEKGHGVVVRSQLTTDRYKFEYVNTPQNPIYALTEAALQRFDLVLMDGDTYNSLGPTARQRLWSAVENGGLGLFLQPVENGWDGRNVPLRTVPDARTQGQLHTENGAVLNTYPYAFQTDFPVQALHFGGVPVGAYRRMGLGKVGSTVLRPTYPLLLQGKRAVYEGLWSQLLTALAKPGDQNGEVHVGTELPRPHEPMALTLRTSQSRPKLSHGNGQQMALQQALWLPQRWQGTHYPAQTGWQQLMTATDTTAFYVYPDSAWRTRTAHQYRAANARSLGTIAKPAPPTAHTEPMAPFWWFVPLLLALGFLWLWPKIN